MGEKGITSIQFHLTQDIDAQEAGALTDSQMVCGDSVDALGIPYYQSQINEFVRSFVQTFNDIEKTGVDLKKNPMGAFFVGNIADYQDSTSGQTATEMNNGEAKYDIAEKLLTLQKDVKMFRGDSAESFLETLLSDITVDVDKTNTNYKNYFNLQTAVNNQRTSVSGVDEDEEALNLIKFQNAYNLASKVISVLAEMYDKLINETGV